MAIFSLIFACGLNYFRMQKALDFYVMRFGMLIYLSLLDGIFIVVELNELNEMTLVVVDRLVQLHHL